MKTVLTSKFNAVVRKTLAATGLKLCGLRKTEKIGTLSQMLDIAPNSITIHDFEGNFLYANQRTLELHGYDEPSEFMALHLRRVDVPESAERIAERMRLIDEKGEACFEVEHYRKDGTTFPLEVYARKTIWRGAPALISIATDITERKQEEQKLRESEENLATTLQSIGEAVIAADRSGLVVNMNPVAEALCGWTLAEARQKPLTDVFRIVNAITRIVVEDPVKKVLETGEIAGLANHTMLLSRNGDEYQIADSAAPIRNRKGEITGVVLVFRDVTRQYALRESLARSEYRYRSTIESAPVGMYFYRLEEDDRLVFEAANNAADRITGVDSAAFIGKTIEEAFPGLASTEVPARYRKTAALGETWSAEQIDYDEGGIKGAFEITAFQTDVGKMAVFFSDISGRKETEEALQRKVQELDLYFNSSLDLLCIADTEGRFIRLNPEWERVLGYSLAEIEGKTFIDFVHPEDRDATMATISRLGDQEEVLNFENRYRCKDGSHRWLEWRSKPHGSTIYAVARDISERRRMDKELQRAHHRLITVLDSIQAFIYVADIDTHEILFVNRYGGNAWGDITGRLCWQALQQDQSGPCPFCTNDKLLDETGAPTGTHVWEFQNTINQRWYECRDSAVRWTDGRMVRIEIATDISERKRTEIEIQKFKNIFDNANFGAAIADMNGRLTYINECYAAAHGYEAEELTGRHLCALHNEDQMEAVNGLYAEVQSAGRFDTREVWHCRRDGSTFPMLMVGTLVKDAQGAPQYFTATAIDLTERKELEAQMHQARKMESIGRLAGGIAHDFNNMLSVILGHANMLLEDVAPEGKLRNGLEAIQYAADRSAALTRQLLGFARKQMIFPKILDLNIAVGNMIRMLRRIVGEDVAIDWKPGANLWPVRMDPSQVDQILVNLAANARDALPGTGEVLIRTANIALDKDYGNNHADFIPGDYVMLSFSDSGCGMDRDTLDRLFEPFFTTKTVGEGTGMGLPTVYGIVKQNDGIINVYSEPGQGTTFTIYLPRHSGEDVSVFEEPPPSPIPTERETLLVVEDDPSILELCGMMLKNLGYPVLEAATPAEALRIAEEHPGKIHLLVSDVVMPKMNGPDLARRLLSLRPDIKCLFMSGYPADVIASRGILDQDMGFIQKPFTRKNLDAKIREIFKDRSSLWRA